MEGVICDNLDIQAMLVTFLEELLYLGADEVEGEMYPAAMVIATSALGLAVTQRLSSQQLLGRQAAWILYCVFLSKLSMLVLPQVHLPIAQNLLKLALTQVGPLLISMITM